MASSASFPSTGFQSTTPSAWKAVITRAGGKILYHASCNPVFNQNTSLCSAPDFIAHRTQTIPRAAAGCEADGGSPSRGQSAASITMGFAPHGAKHAGLACLTSRVSTPRGGASPRYLRQPNRHRSLRARHVTRPMERGPENRLSITFVRKNVLHGARQ